jgi:hypothetical protein
MVTDVTHCLQRVVVEKREIILNYYPQVQCCHEPDITFVRRVFSVLPRPSI